MAERGGRSHVGGNAGAPDASARRGARRRGDRARRVARQGNRNPFLRHGHRPLLSKRGRAGRRRPARDGERAGRRSARRRRDRGRRLGALDRRRRVAVDRRQEDRSSLSLRRGGRGDDSRLPVGTGDDGLSARASARLLLGDLDGRSRPLPAAPRPGTKSGRAQGDDRALSGHAARRDHPPLPVGGPVQRRERRSSPSFATIRPNSPVAPTARCAAPARRCSPSTGATSSTRKARSQRPRGFAITIPRLAERASSVWRGIGSGAFRESLDYAPRRRSRPQEPGGGGKLRFERSRAAAAISYKGIP